MVRLVVAYDITDDRRRVRLHRLLLGFGDPVQFSVFECELSAGQTKEVRRRVRRLLRPGDRVRFYALCEHCATSIEERLGPVPLPPEIYLA